MFNKIVESVLNEISAEDAYTKFYNVLPKSDFDKLVSTYGGKFDNLIKAILNSIKEYVSDGKDPQEMFSKAYTFINDYKSAPNEIRIAFNKNFKNGDYEDFIDMCQGLSELKESGVDTLKSIQNLGLITLLDDDNYRLTCTTTYEASHHFYGKSSWCTASDRLGQYDGWEYFITYIFDIEADIIEDVYENLLTKHEPVACLVQFTNKKDNKTYQMQVFGSDGMPGQICDFEDNSCDIDELGMPEELMDLLQSSASHLVYKTKEAFAKEYPYQKSRDKYIEDKRQQLVIRRRALITQHTDTIQNKLVEKSKFIQAKIKELMESNLLTNPEYVQQLIRYSHSIEMSTRNAWQRDMGIDEINNLENMLKQMKYMIVDDIKPSSNGLVVMRIRPSIGQTLKIDYGNGNMPVMKNTFVYEDSWFDCYLKGNIAIVAKTSNDSAEFDDIEIESIIKVSKDETNEIRCFTLYNLIHDMANYTGGSELLPYILIEHISSVGMGGTSELLRADTLQSVIVKKRIASAIIYDDYLFLNIIEIGRPFIVLNKNTLEALFYLNTNAIEPRSYSWLLGKNPKTDELFLMTDKLVPLGVRYKGTSINSIDGEYYRNGLIVITKYGENYSSIVYNYATKKVECENVNFDNYIDKQYKVHYVAEFEDGEEINFD